MSYNAYDMKLRKRNNSIDLLRELIKTNLKLRYNDSLLGVLWVMMKPLLNFLVLFFVFSAFRGGVDKENYAASLLIGLIVYTFIQEGITFGMNSLLSMQGIILKVNFPRNLAVLSAVLVSMINFFINLFIILLLTLFVNFVPNPLGVLYFFLIMLVILVIIYSASLILSILVIRIRDLENIVPIFFQLLFWGSAIFYDINSLSGTVGEIVRHNPVAILIDASRQALINGSFNYLHEMAFLVVVALVMFVVSRLFFNVEVKKIAEHI